MPTRRAELDSLTAAAHVSARSFRPARADLIGIEIEVLPVGPDGRRADHEQVLEVVAGLRPLGSGTAITFEPGGQLELSTQPQRRLDDACSALADDLDSLDRALGPAGIGLAGVGLDPTGSAPYRRAVRSPRYDAMAGYLAAQGPFGETMMCATAGIQVNLDCERSGRCPTLRFGLAHLVGPTLAASFANSPLAGGRPTGWKSSRLANWWRLDPCRTAPAASPGSGPAAWSSYALAAQVMMIRTPTGLHVPVDRPLSFAQWIACGHESGYPNLDDLDYHLTTLFPPVRPRGWLELRMFDSLPGPWWRVPVAVSAALIYDPGAAEVAAWATRRTAGLWVEASRSGLEHPLLAASARTCFSAAMGALDRLGVDTTTTDAVGAYADRFVARGRTPADEMLDRFHSRGGAWDACDWLGARRAVVGRR